MEKFTFFYGGEFSQWYNSPMTVKGVFFNCAEQAMMMEKAILFNDNEACNKIMKTDDPVKQKFIGRHVKGFDKKVWESVAREIVYYNNLCKFTQNPKLLKVLLDTVGTTLVEVSPTDKIWGIGLAEYNPRALVKKYWKGLNWLGMEITRVRDNIMTGRL